MEIKVSKNNRNKQQLNSDHRAIWKEFERLFILHVL